MSSFAEQSDPWFPEGDSRIESLAQCGRRQKHTLQNNGRLHCCSYLCPLLGGWACLALPIQSTRRAFERLRDLLAGANVNGMIRAGRARAWPATLLILRESLLKPTPPTGSTTFMPRIAHEMSETVGNIDGERIEHWDVSLRPHPRPIVRSRQCSGCTGTSRGAGRSWGRHRAFNVSRSGASARHPPSNARNGRIGQRLSSICPFASGEASGSISRCRTPLPNRQPKASLHGAAHERKTSQIQKT